MTKKRIIFLGIIGVLSVIIVAVLIYVRYYQNLPEFSLPLLENMNAPTQGQTMILFSPHTDDEALSSGGLIKAALNNGAKVYVVFLTNGDGHRFSSVEEFHKLYPNAQDYIQSGYSRQQESLSALESLGVPKQNIIFLGYPDGGLKTMLTANFNSPYESNYTKQNFSPYVNSYSLGTKYTGVNVVNDMGKILQETRPNDIFVSHPDDLHADHAAAPVFLSKALAQYQQQLPTAQYQEYYYLVHFRHFPYPKGDHEERYLMPPMRLLTTTWTSFSLSPDEEKAKKIAIEKYQSQLKVPLLNSLMWGFVKKNEIFVKAN